MNMHFDYLRFSWQWPDFDFLASQQNDLGCSLVWGLAKYLKICSCSLSVKTSFVQTISVNSWFVIQGNLILKRLLPRTVRTFKVLSVRLEAHSNAFSKSFTSLIANWALSNIHPRVSLEMLEKSFDASASSVFLSIISRHFLERSSSLKNWQWSRIEQALLALSSLSRKSTQRLTRIDSWYFLAACRTCITFCPLKVTSSV